tara:strand:+ start:323 stop:502 length:180 start_codon:yes stop_codon:yes gene_type:complete
MPKTNLIGSCEVTLKSALNRISKLEGRNKNALVNEYREWINAIEGEDKNYDVLYINEII